MKKRILSMLLACVLLLSALPMGSYAAQASPRYTVSASQDQTTDVGKTVSMTVFVAEGSYNAYDLTLTYDTARLTYVSGQAADKGASVTEKSESIRVIGYGADKSASTKVVTLTFKTKAAGTAKVVISSAKIDTGTNAPTKNAPPAAISRSTTKFTIQPGYTVTLDEGLASDSLSAAAGEDYTFRATDPLHYDYKPSAKIGGQDVTDKLVKNGDGSYTIPGSEINGNITVKANRTPKTYKVTFKGEDLSGEKTAAYNTPYHFKLNRKAGYSYVLRMTIGGKSYTGYKAENGGYVIPGADITGDIVITALKNKINSGSGGSSGGSSAKYVSVSFIGSGAGDASGKTSTRRGAEYTFRVSRKDGTPYDVSASVNGVTVKCTYDSKKDIYRIPGSAVTGDITVTVTKGAPVEVSTYVTLDNQSMYLVIYTGNVEDGHVPMYDGQNMYWSKAYNAYAWLVISSADEKEVAQAAQNSITIGEGKAAAAVDYSGNVDLSGRIDVDDVHLAHDVYNARYTLVSLMMHKFLNGDVNGDRKVDIQDSVWIVNRILREK